MALETATYIDDLDVSNPVGASDPKSQGDDHIRLLKAVLKATFPNATGAYDLNNFTQASVANVWTATQTFQSDDAGATAGPVIYIKRNSASPAASDQIGLLDFIGKDSLANDVRYGGIIGFITDPTNGSMDGGLLFTTQLAGSIVVPLTMGPGGIQVGAPTGGDKGYGALNATTLWQNGSAVLDSTDTGSGNGLDADKLDGQHGSYYLPASSYTAADVLTKIKTVDGAGSGLDADLLDGQSSAYYTSATNLTSGTLPDARLTGTYTGITINTTGSITTSSTIQAGSTFKSSGATGIFGNSSSGTLYFRPVSTGSSTGQMTLSSAGLLSVSDISYTSDMALKENFAPIADALGKIKQLAGYTYDRKDTHRKSAGLVAQDFLMVLPEAVTKDAEGKLGISPGPVLALLVEAIKELAA